MPRASSWTCQRTTGGVKCRAVNPNRARKCGVCGKPRAPRRKPAHMTVLEQPYTAFLEMNGGIERCGICGAEPGTRRLHRDHDHRLGVPRGLLCFRCNSALRPYLTEEWLLDAADYMERARLRQVQVDMETIAAAARRPAA